VADREIPCAMSTSPRKQSEHILLGDGCILVPQIQQSTSAYLVTEGVVIDEYDLLADILSLNFFLSPLLILMSAKDIALKVFEVENQVQV
jgi:hypothetical protein